MKGLIKLFIKLFYIKIIKHEQYKLYLLFKFYNNPPQNTFYWTIYQMSKCMKYAYI